MPLINVEPDLKFQPERPGEASKSPPAKSTPAYLDPFVDLVRDRWTVLGGECVQVMKTLEDDCIDSIVTDPPYGLKFMGKDWDNVEYEFHLEWAKQAFRVLKPGGHLIAFSGSRTYHWLAAAVEDAGFEVRDMLMWLYGQGFPKSRNMGKDDEAWGGWGTALKPAHEPMVLARKPLSEKNVISNLREHGTGAINIDATRIGYQGRFPANVILTHHPECETTKIKAHSGTENRAEGSGRYGDFSGVTKGKRVGVGDEDGMETVELWRCREDCAVRLLDEQTGILKSGKATQGGHKRRATADPDYTTPVYEGGKDGSLFNNDDAGTLYGDAGGASRFFYNAKASKGERERGLLGKLPCTKCGELDSTHHESASGKKQKCVRNDHPTVKPIALMEYLVRLVTPIGGVVLDPFLGSGSTGIAAVRQDSRFIGIEMKDEYLPLAKTRIRNG